MDPQKTLDPSAGFVPLPSAGDPSAGFIPLPEAPPAPGFIDRVTQGLPHSLHEAAAMTGTPTSWHELADMLHQGQVPFDPASAMIHGYLNTAKKGIQEGAQEAKEAGENVAEGGPIGANIGKAIAGGAHAALQAIPGVGPVVETAGQDFHEGNYPGAAGGLTNAVAQIALMGKAGGPEAEALVETPKTPQPGILQRGAVAAVKGVGGIVRKAAASPLGQELGNTARAIGVAEDPDIVGMASPRLANAMRAAGKFGKIAEKAAPPEPAPPPAVQTPAGVAPAPPQAPPAPSPAAPPPSGAIAQAMQAKTAPPVEAAPAAQPPTQPPPSGAIAAAMKKPTIADVGEQIEQGLGGRKLIPNVPLRYQMKPPEPEHMGQFARANGLELHQAIPETPAGDVLRAKIHDLSNVQVRELAIKSGEDMGQQSVSNAKNSGGVPRQEVLSRVLKHHSPEQIGQLIDTLDTKLGSSRGKIAAGMKGKP